MIRVEITPFFGAKGCKKMNKIKRGLTLLLTMILLCTALPISAQAKTTGNKTVNKANIVLFGYFADDTQTAADAYFDQYAGELVGYIDGSFGRSLKNYLNSISYGQLQIKNTIPQYDGTTVHALQVPVKESDALVQNLDTQIIESLIRQMPSIADKAVDLDGDGYVDNVMVILKASQSSKASSSATLVAHKSDYSGSAKINNKPVVGYNVFGTDRLRSEGSSLLAHEYLHTFGYPDLYRNSGNDRPVYSWSVMGGVIPGSPQYPLAYERMYFTHWIDIDTVTQNSTLTLDDQANADGNQAFILKSPLNDHEIFVVEYRKKPPINYTEQDSLDCRIGGTGVIVYRVNLNVDGLTNLRGYTGIYVFRPQSGQPGYTGNEILDVSRAYLPYKDDSTGKTRSTIGSADMNATLADGALTFSDGSNSGIVLKNIAVSANKQQATLEVEIPQKSDYDLWQDLNYTATGNMTYGVTMTEVDGALYTVAAENKKIRSRKYENGAWTDFAPEISESFASEFQLARQGSNLYMAFNDTNGAARLMRYDLTAGGSWQAVRTVDNAGTGVSLRVIGGKLYMACITNRQVGYMYYNDLLLMQVDGATATDLGTYVSGTFIGQPKLVDYGGPCLLYRSGNSVITALKWNGTAFEKFSDDTVKGNFYDVISSGGKLYLSLGGSTLQTAIYDGSNWTLGPNSGITCGETAWTTLGGALYLVASPNTESGNLLLYRYDNGTFTQEGERIDSPVSTLTACPVSNTVYLSYVRGADQKITFKSKTVSPPKAEVDCSALEAALSLAAACKEAQYSAESLAALQKEVDTYTPYLTGDVTQAQIDAGTTAVLTAIYKLAPYFDLTVTALNGTCAATVGNQTGGCGGYKPLKGTDVTLVALPYDGYTFVGWYDKINHRYMSRNTTYHFTATTNAQLQAVCVKTGSSTLTFATESGWISATVTRTTAEWAATDSLADLLPEVPYRYGYTATGWDCDERTVLEKLRSGQNVTLLPTYTADDTSLPTPSPAKDGVPVLDLYYKLDEKNNVGSFVMAAGWPDYLDIQSVGVAFYYKDAADFDPTDFTLLLNNKMLASNFNTDSLEETYVVNIKKLSNRYNWAARGYVNYYDQNRKLQTVYSNQINLIAREQV